MDCFLEGRDANTKRPSWLVEEEAALMNAGVGGQKTKVPASGTSPACDRHLSKATTALKMFPVNKLKTCRLISFEVFARVLSSSLEKLTLPPFCCGLSLSFIHGVSMIN